MLYLWPILLVSFNCSCRRQCWNLCRKKSRAELKFVLSKFLSRKTKKIDDDVVYSDWWWSGHPQFLVLNNSSHFGPIVRRRPGDGGRRIWHGLPNFIEFMRANKFYPATDTNQNYVVKTLAVLKKWHGFHGGMWKTCQPTNMFLTSCSFTLELPLVLTNPSSRINPTTLQVQRTNSNGHDNWVFIVPLTRWRPER